MNEMIRSNSSNRSAGSRDPAPITTQSKCFDFSAVVATCSAVFPRSIRQLAASYPSARGCSIWASI
jgi:hypothetical protein